MDEWSCSGYCGNHQFWHGSGQGWCKVWCVLTGISAVIIVHTIDLWLTGHFPSQWKDTISSQAELVEMGNQLFVVSTITGWGVLHMSYVNWCVLIRDDKNQLLFLLKNEIQLKVYIVATAEGPIVNVHRNQAVARPKGMWRNYRKELRRVLKLLWSIVRNRSERVITQLDPHWYFCCYTTGVDIMPSLSFLVTLFLMYVFLFIHHNVNIFVIY